MYIYIYLSVYIYIYLVSWKSKVTFRLRFCWYRFVYDFVGYICCIFLWYKNATIVLRFVSWDVRQTNLKQNVFYDSPDTKYIYICKRCIPGACGSQANISQRCTSVMNVQSCIPSGMNNYSFRKANATHIIFILIASITKIANI